MSGKTDVRDPVGEPNHPDFPSGRIVPLFEVHTVDRDLDRCGVPQYPNKGGR